MLATLNTTVFRSICLVWLCSIRCVDVCAQSCPTLCNPMDCITPGSSVHGIFQARILEWVAISSSRGSSKPRDQTRISCVSCIAGGDEQLSKFSKLKNLINEHTGCCDLPWSWQCYWFLALLVWVGRWPAQGTAPSLYLWLIFRPLKMTVICYCGLLWNSLSHFIPVLGGWRASLVVQW